MPAKRTEFSYKGKKIVIEEDHPHAVVTVDGRAFTCHHHHLEEGKGLPMWMCVEAYFTSPDLKELARHFADYGYMFDDPNRVVVDDDGNVIKRDQNNRPPGKKKPDEKPEAGEHGGHDPAGGEPRGMP
jgi:hypothetical protein